MHWADWVLSQDAKPYSITFHWHTPHDGGAEIQWTRHVQSAESATQLESLFLLLQRDRIWQVLHSDLGHKHEISGLQGGKLSCKSLPLDVLRTYHPGHRKHQRGTVWTCDISSSVAESMNSELGTCAQTSYTLDSMQPNMYLGWNHSCGQCSGVASA